MATKIVRMLSEPNAVSNTAEITSYWLASSGNENAKCIFNTLHFHKGINPNTIPFFDQLRIPNTIAYEVRYRSVNDEILRTGIRSVVDLACGYSPRGLDLNSMGINYIGGDMEVVVNKMKKICPFKKSKNILDYVIIDVVDYYSLEKAASSIPSGPLVIIAEGLMPYLTIIEKTRLLSFISSILSKRGGVFITPDFSSNDIAMKLCDYLFNESALKIFNYSREMFNSASDGGLIDPLNYTSGEVKFLFDECGLNATFSSMMKEDINFNSINELNKNDRSNVKMILSKATIVKAQASNKIQSEEPDSKKFFICNIDNVSNVLKITIFGILDSLTSSAFVFHYDLVNERNNYEMFKHVELDALETTFISSLAIKLLMKIVNNTIDKELIIKNPNQEVQRSFELFGFKNVTFIHR